MKQFIGILSIVGLSACGASVSPGESGPGNDTGLEGESGGPSSDAGAGSETAIAPDTGSDSPFADQERISIVEIQPSGTTRTIMVYGYDCTVMDDGVVVGKMSALTCADLWMVALDATTGTAGDCKFDPATNPRLDLRLVTRDGVEYRKDEITWCHPGISGPGTYRGLIAAALEAEGVR